MTPLTTAFVVIAALTHATWNLIAKRAAHAGAPFILTNTLVSLLLYAPWVAWVLATGGMRVTAAALGCILLSGAIRLAYSLALQRGYRVADLSVVYPMARGTAPLLASVAAIALFGERPGAAGLAGLAAVVAGIVLIATDGRLRRFADAAARAGVNWGLLTGAAIASYSVVDAWGVKALAIAPVVLDWGSNAARVTLLAPVVLRRPRAARTAMRGFWLHALAVGAIGPLGYILVLTALRMGAPLSFVAPAREMSMMVGALFGMILLGERASRWRLAGCAVMIAGVILLGTAA